MMISVIIVCYEKLITTEPILGVRLFFQKKEKTKTKNKGKKKTKTKKQGEKAHPDV